VNPGRWQRVQAVAKLLMDAEGNERSPLMQQLCGDDLELRREVASLLEATAETRGCLDDLPVAPGPQDDLPSGGSIGPYRLVCQIGSGGMGVLYEAVRQDGFQKKVALKIIKRGMDSVSIVRRFQRERQILAGLNHANITMLLDGGATEDGRPYFVMEYVEGRPITAYCDAHKLSTRERLELFRSVCSAVHYAHQNLVVHRDLKPSNILVSTAGVPKLLDFGIAKILNLEVTAAAVDLTMASMRVMTPEYASPEQVRGEPITTATDVYSLGVVLYELLTGHRPYRFKTRSPLDIARVICEQEPEKPSTAVGRAEEGQGEDGRSRRITPEVVSATREGGPEQLRRRLRGDLDNIILKALDKEPGRRYTSVEQFSEDLRRHLAGLPVIARKDTPGYRAGKFIHRHKVGVFAAGLVALSLIGGLIGTAWQARIAGAERRKAERRFNDVRKLARSVLFELHDGISALHGSTAVRELLVKRALEYLDSLARDAEGDISLQRELAEAYERIGSVQGEPAEANLGNTRGALESYWKALAIRERIAAADPANRGARSELAASYSNLGAILDQSGDSRADFEYQRKALAICERLAAESPGDSSVRLSLAGAYHHMAASLYRAGDSSASLEARRKALAIFKELAATYPAGLHVQRNLALGHRYMGSALAALQRLDEALENFRAALAIDESLAAANPASAQARMDVSFDLSEIGACNLQQHKLAEALNHYRKAHAIRESVAAADPKDARVRERLAYTHERLGDTFLQMGQAPEAMNHYRQMIAIREALAQADSPSADKRLAVGQGYWTLGAAYLSLAKKHPRNNLWREARTWLQRALDTYQTFAARGALHGEDASAPDRIRSRLAECEAALGELGR
jgi:non-specific serine/threonine protein kinase/serine/threonine-protein kinase